MARRKHMKMSAVTVQLHFHGKRPELRIKFTEKVAKQLYRRLKNRFEKE
jgi:hypothetical protein